MAAAAAHKWLIVVVDGTAAMGPYWSTIVSDYLLKIVRYFCGQSQGQVQELSGAITQLGLIMYKGRGLYHDFLVRPSAWTREADTFEKWLSDLHFSGGGHNEAAIADGLANALVMFPKPRNESDQDKQGIIVERHCILVAASNPFPLPRLLQLPKIGDGKSFTSQTEWRLGDPELVAKMFPQCSVSLSVICPKKLPKLREIFNVGNCDKKELDLPNNVGMNPYYLTLLSEEFKEARDAIAQCEATNKLPTHSTKKMETDLDLIFPDLDTEVNFSEEDLKKYEAELSELIAGPQKPSERNVPAQALGPVMDSVKEATPETIIADRPPTLNDFMSLHHYNSIPPSPESHLLFLEASNNHLLYDIMREKGKGPTPDGSLMPLEHSQSQKTDTQSADVTAQNETE